MELSISGSGLKDDERRIAKVSAEGAGGVGDLCVRPVTLNGSGSTWKWNESTQRLIMNFPEHFKPEANLVIDIFEDGASLDELQDKITLALSHAFDSATELGGAEKDVRSLQHAISISRLLTEAAKAYRLESTVIVVAFRALFVLTAVGGVLEGDLQSEEGDPPEFWVTEVGVVLPLLLGLVATLYSTYRPMQKFAALWFAAKQIDGEIYRFRTRTKDYRSVKSSVSGRGHRRAFSRACDQIIADCGNDDVRSGVASLADPSVWRQQRQLSAPSKKTKVCRIFTCCSRKQVSEDSEDNSVLGAEEYIETRLLPAMVEAQREAPILSTRLRRLQFLIILGSSVCAAFQSVVPAWTPVVLSVVASLEFFVSCKKHPHCPYDVVSLQQAFCVGLT